LQAQPGEYLISREKIVALKVMDKIVKVFDVGWNINVEVCQVINDLE
jgi:hypothetical protein